MVGPVSQEDLNEQRDLNLDSGVTSFIKHLLLPVLRPVCTCRDVNTVCGKSDKQAVTVQADKK
jgi:hypothetical protein